MEILLGVLLALVGLAFTWGVQALLFKMAAQAASTKLVTWGTALWVAAIGTVAASVVQVTLGGLQVGLLVSGSAQIAVWTGTITVFAGMDLGESFFVALAMAILGFVLTGALLVLTLGMVMGATL